MKLEVIIGLEVHIQAKTKSKMFCGCNNDAEKAEPNTLICPVCMGYPGSLPVINQRAVELGIAIAHGLQCQINPQSYFDRKNYFYPDLSKGYQITQHFIPLAENGGVTFFVASDKTGNKIDGYRKHIRIERVQLEEDTAKSQYESDGSIALDFNRAGSPLFEIVTKPDFTTPYEAKIFLQELRMLARYFDVSDADMEKGMLRCDANISLRPEGDTKYYSKTEIKNINSFKAVEKALSYEISRQQQLWEAGTPPDVSTTRMWNDMKGETIEMRSKESYADYRYFSEPDVVPLAISASDESYVFCVKKIKNNLGELPWDKRERFISEYGLSREQVNSLIEDKYLARYFEQVVSEIQLWLKDNNDYEKNLSAKERLAQAVKTTYGFISGQLLKLCMDTHCDFKDIKCSAEDFAELVTLFFEKRVNNSLVQKILKNMFETGLDPHKIIEKENIGQVDRSENLEPTIRLVLDKNPNEVVAYKQGKTTLLQFFIGQVMRETKGAADPDTTRSILEKLLS